MMLLCSFTVAHAQIDFSDYYDTPTLSSLALSHLNFGTIIVGDTPQIAFGSQNEGVIQITGLPFLDVMVTITPITVLYLGGDDTCTPLSTCSIPVTIDFNYTNNGFDDFEAGYELAAMPFIANFARFQVLGRQTGPPRPPPPPNIDGVQLPAAREAYIYVSGSINDTIDAQPGSYSNTITINIAYN